MLYRGDDWTKNIVNCLEQIYNDILTNPVDYIVWLGDFFDSASPDLDALYEFINIKNKFLQMDAVSIFLRGIF